MGALDIADTRRAAARATVQPEANRLGGLALDGAIVLLLALLPLLFFWRMELAPPDQRFTVREGDFTQEYVPLALVAARSLRAGEWPFWNPLTGAGEPLLADPQTALLYPPTWWALLRMQDAGATSLQAFEDLIPLHIALAAIGGYALGRYLFRSRLAALVTALTFAFCGFLISYPVQQLPILRVAAWLPWQALFLLLALDRRSFGWAALAGIAFALGILAGHPQMALLHLYALGILALCWWVAEVRRGVERGTTLAMWGLARLAFALLIGFLLAAPQILPALEYQRLSTRDVVSFSFLANGFAPREILVGLLAPRLLGGDPPYVGGLPPYVGVLPLLLAIVAVLVARGRATLYGLALAAFGLFLSLGGNSVLFSLLYLVAPGFSLFRGQERGIEIFAFGMAILAGAGADVLAGPLGALARRRLRLLLAGGGIATILGAGLLVALSWAYLARDAGAARDRVQVAMDASGWFLIMLAAGLVLLALLFSRRAARLIWAPAVVALIVLDLFSVAPDASLADKRPDDVYRASEIVKRLQAETAPHRVLDQDVLNGHHGLAYGVPAIEPGFILKVRRYEEVRAAAAPQRLFDLFNGRFLVTRERHDDLESVLEEPYADTVNRLYRLPGQPAPAWLVAEARTVPDSQASLAAVLAEGFRPADTAIFEATDAPPPRPSSGGAVERVTPGWARSALTVSTPGGAYLVISQAFFPGWSATVDGAATPLYSVDHALTGLWVPAGRHDVVLRYEPSGLRLGLGLAALGLVLGVGAVVATLARRGPPDGEARVKLFILLTLVMALPAVVFLARRRIWLALKVAAVMLIAVNLVRFVSAAQSDDAADQFLNLGLALGAFGVVWLVLWVATRYVERQRALHPPAPRPTERRPRWRLCRYANRLGTGQGSWR